MSNFGGVHFFDSWVNFFKKDFTYLFLERGEGRKRGRETSICVASRVPRTRDLAHNPGICPDWESNQWLFGSQADTQSTKPHQPGLKSQLSSVNSKNNAASLFCTSPLINCACDDEHHLYLESTALLSNKNKQKIPKHSDLCIKCSPENFEA